MLEVLLGNSKKLSDYIFEVNFENAVIGTKSITDRAKGIVLNPIGNTAGANFGVKDVAGVGKCFQFDGNAYFYNVPCPLGNFSAESYDFEIGFIKPNAFFQILFGTGCYTTYRENGWSLIIDQTPSPIQPLQIYNYPTTTRQYFTGVNTQQYTELVIQKRKTETRLINKTTGVTVTVPAVAYSGDSYLSIGAEHGAVYPFMGFLKYLRIKKVIE